MTWLLNNSLWLVAIGLCLASSGLDGAYMAAWMPPSAPWLGYVLNTVSDVAGMTIMYHFGRLQQTRQNEAGGKRRLKLSRILIAVEIVTVAYSWLFCWRQLRIVLPAIEPDNWGWMALVAAGFVPLLLAAVGYTQALLAGRIETAQVARPTETSAEDTQITADIAEVAVPFSDNGAEPPYRICTPCGFTAKTPQAWAGHCKGAQHKRNTAQVVTEVRGDGREIETVGEQSDER